MLKSLVWRIIGVFWLAGITWLFTHHWVTVGLVTFIHHSVFLVVFYLHERVWFLTKWNSKWKYAIKAITYEVILGNVILGIITYLVTGNVKQMTAVTLIYIQSKIILYFFYDWLWFVRKKRIVVYAYVVADILHIGHLRAIRNAKKQGDYLIVGVLTDEAAMEKKPKPIIPLDERREIVRSINFVDKTVIQKDYSPLNNVKKIKPDVLMECDTHEEMPANAFVKNYGGKVEISKYYYPQSSTKIKNKIIKQNKEEEK